MDLGESLLLNQTVETQDEAKDTPSQLVCYLEQMSRNLSVTEQEP